jgi:hypothetical protein
LEWHSSLQIKDFGGVYMLESEWNAYKALMRTKCKNKPEELLKLEHVFLWFETTKGKFDLNKWQAFVRNQGKRMPQAEKDAILEDTKAEMEKQGVTKDGIAADKA